MNVWGLLRRTSRQGALLSGHHPTSCEQLPRSVPVARCVLCGGRPRPIPFPLSTFLLCCCYAALARAHRDDESSVGSAYDFLHRAGTAEEESKEADSVVAGDEYERMMMVGGPPAAGAVGDFGGGATGGAGSSGGNSGSGLLIRVAAGAAATGEGGSSSGVTRLVSGATVGSAALVPGGSGAAAARAVPSPLTPFCTVRMETGRLVLQVGGCGRVGWHAAWACLLSAVACCVAALSWATMEPHLHTLRAMVPSFHGVRSAHSAGSGR